MLLNRETVLTEDTPKDFAEANEFRLLPEDNVATNPLISFRVRSFVPTDSYNPGKPFQTRLMWRDPSGDSRSKLLLTKPEMVISIVLRGQAARRVATRSLRRHAAGWKSGWSRRAPWQH